MYCRHRPTPRPWGPQTTPGMSDSFPVRSRRVSGLLPWEVVGAPRELQTPPIFPQEAGRVEGVKRAAFGVRIQSLASGGTLLIIKVRLKRLS